MSSKTITQKDAHFGVIIGANRRVFELLDLDSNVRFQGKALAKFKNVTVGDNVRYIVKGHEASIIELLPRKNALERNYFDKSLTIAANVDHLFIISAVPPLFNTIFIDRILVCAYQREIPYSLIINKMDLDDGLASALLAPYKQIEVPLILMSAKTGEGYFELVTSLDNSEDQLILFCGVSGVGKSTLLNRLIPEAERRTGEVSEKTGQGRQTTSYARAYSYARKNKKPLLIVDSPGLQHFGLSSMTKDDVKDAFPEFQILGQYCGFSDCSHIGEKDCGVKRAVEAGEFALSRYESYLHIIAEIEAARPY